ncbi:AraC family transcriptional regulator [Neobacillus soli]|uniref:AraC family transcriptional regulator n=1 Tax=Neobacillus soli TaxID=220688 RepID=UPI000825EC6D|nr:AraC family transcriptional regulator [Neobacillus soli]
MDNWINAHYRMQGMPTSTFDFHSHLEYEIYFFHAGECRYLINNRIYDLQPGDILLMDGLTLHKPNPNPCSESTYTRSVIHFSPAYLQELLSVLGAKRVLDPFVKLNNCLLRTGYDESAQFVDERIERIARMLSNSDKERQQTGQKNVIILAEMKLEFVQLLIAIYKISQKKLSHVPSKPTEKEQHAETMASWINKNYTEKVSLDRLAAELNLSKYYASHVFKEVTGFTVMEYLMGCRVNQAKYLLEMEPNWSLAEVSRHSGFESSAHFSRYFKDKVGITPSNYRRNRLNSNHSANKEEQ